MWDFDAATGDGTDYIYLAGRLVANQRPAAAGGISYYYNDLQGSVIATTDAAGTFITAVDYRPYGEQVLGATETGPGYTGHVNDPDLGLVYMQARYYDPSVGRFASADAFAMMERERAVRGDEGARSEEMVVRPGETRKITLAPKPDVRFLGVAVLFQDIDRAQWRAIAAIAANGTTRLVLAVGSNKAVLEPA